MYINVIYPRKFHSFSVKRKSIRFFSKTAYIFRNNVFIHPELDSVFSLNKNRIHIHIPDDNHMLQNITRDYLSTIFGDTAIGLRGLNEEHSKMFESLNYFKI